MGDHDSRNGDGKAVGAMLAIGELADRIGVPTHVLRYWEQQFPMLNPLKRSGGRRYYRSEDIRMVDTIDRLVNREGYTLKGARLVLEGGMAEKRPVVAPTVTTTTAAPAQAPAADIAPQLRAIRKRLAEALDG